jgi:cytochrome c biogenesis protein CcdA
MEELKKIESLIEKLRDYVNTRIAQVKLSVAEKVSKVAALVVAVLMAALVFFLFLVLLSVAGAIAVGQWLQNYWLGFLIIAGIILITGILLWSFKEKWIQKPIMNLLIKTMFSNKDDDDEEE